jgi:hypothetical protein
MNKGRSRFSPNLSDGDQILENRVVLSATAVHSSAAETARMGATQTTLAISAGTLGQPVTFTAMVRGTAAAGAPQGTVNFIDRGQSLGTVQLVPAKSTNPRYAESTGTGTLTPQPGGLAFYFGKHTDTAEFIPEGAFAKSRASRTFTVNKPSYTTLAHGVQMATIAQGSGPQIQSGQTAHMLYTGYLAKNGKIFADSANNSGNTSSFKVGSGQVIAGLDAGMAGMAVGETRIVVIPPAEGYGAKRNGNVPRNSTLVFVVTLESIS